MTTVSAYKGHQYEGYTGPNGHRGPKGPEWRFRERKEQKFFSLFTYCKLNDQDINFTIIDLSQA